MSVAFDRLSSDVLAKIAEKGRAYTNETAHMARELIAAREEIAVLRAKLDAGQPVDLYAYVLGGP